MNGRMKIALVAVLLLASGAALRQEDAVKTLMKAKREYAHRLLDAVVQGDFDTAREQAFRLKAVAETNDWNVLDTPDYIRESEAFIRGTDRMMEAAKERNQDALALAYMDVTLTCVHCHRHIRAAREKKVR